jgi:hypothetical protein
MGLSLLVNGTQGQVANVQFSGRGRICPLLHGRYSAAVPALSSFGFAIGPPERVPELLESRATTERRAHVQLAVFELLREFPNAHAERTSEPPARPSPV